METSVTKKRSGLPTPPRYISNHVDETACGKCMVIKLVLPPSFSFSPFSASSQGPTLNCLPCSVRCNLTTPSSPPPPPDAIVLQGVVLPPRADIIQGPHSRTEFSQFSAQGHSTRVHCRDPRCLLVSPAGSRSLNQFSAKTYSHTGRSEE